MATSAAGKLEFAGEGFGFAKGVAMALEEFFQAPLVAQEGIEAADQLRALRLPVVY